MSEDFDWDVPKTYYVEQHQQVTVNHIPTGKLHKKIF